MNRFRALLGQIDAQIAVMNKLYPGLSSDVDVEKERGDLIALIGILNDPESEMDKRCAGFIGASAEWALEKLRAYERRFLISAFAFVTMKRRSENLDPDVRERHEEDLRNLFHMYESRRRAEGKDISALRHAYLLLSEIMSSCEAESEEAVEKRVHETIISLESAESPTRRLGKSPEKREKDREIRARMKGRESGGGKKNRRSA